MLLMDIVKKNKLVRPRVLGLVYWHAGHLAAEAGWLLSPAHTNADVTGNTTEPQSPPGGPGWKDSFMSFPG